MAVCRHCGHKGRGFFGNMLKSAAKAVAPAIMPHVQNLASKAIGGLQKKIGFSDDLANMMNKGVAHAANYANNKIQSLNTDGQGISGVGISGVGIHHPRFWNKTMKSVYDGVTRGQIHPSAKGIGRHIIKHIRHHHQSQQSKQQRGGGFSVCSIS